MSDERLTTAVLAPEEEDLVGSLRPRRLDEFVGQERIKEQLGIALEAANDLPTREAMGARDRHHPLLRVVAGTRDQRLFSCRGALLWCRHGAYRSSCDTAAQ